MKWDKRGIPFDCLFENADIYIEDLNIGSFEFLDLKLFYLYDILKISLSYGIMCWVSVFVLLLL